MKDDQWVRFREWYYGHEIRFEASFTDLSQFRLTRESGTVADSNSCGKIFVKYFQSL